MSTVKIRDLTDAASAEDSYRIPIDTGFGTGDVSVAQVRTILATGTTVARTLATRFGEIINANDFDTVDPTGATDSYLGLTAAIAAIPASSGATFILNGNYLIGSPLVLIKSNLTVIQYGKITASATFLANSTMLSVTGSNLVLNRINLDGGNFALRGLSIRPTSRTIRINGITAKNFKAPIGATASPFALGIRWDTRDITVNDVDIDGVTSLTDGISRGLHITPEGAEASPYSIKINGGSIKNVTPIADGDGLCIQNGTSNDVNILVQGITFEGCSKRGIKSMLNGVQIINNVVKAPGYAGISCYGSNTIMRGNRVIDCTGDMCYEVGASGLTLADVLLDGNIGNMASGADITTTGDGIRVYFRTNRRIHCINNSITHARVGINYTGEVSDSVISHNTVNDTTQASIQIGPQTISGTDYFPDTISAIGNTGASSGSTIAVSFISVLNPSSIGNIYNGNGTGSVFTTCTGGVQHSNISDNDIGWLTTQFALDANGKPYIKDGAALANFKATGINFDDATTAASGAPIRAQRTANFTYSISVKNTSTGASAFSSFVTENDSAKTISYNLGGSGTTSFIDRGAIIGSAGVTGLSFRFPTGADYSFDINGVTSIKADGDATGGNTRLLVYDVTAASLKRVSIGAVDSGGAGFKLLRIAN